MMGRGMSLHVGLLVVASASAIYVWTRDPAAKAAPSGETTLWTGRAEDVQRLGFDSATKKISLEPRHDAHGRWFYGTSETPAGAPTDAGPAPAAKRSIFVSVTEARKTAEAVVPFKVSRDIGRVEGARSAEFGFKEPMSTFTVGVAGQEHRLEMGGPAPGGYRYVRDEATGNVYATHGTFIWDLESGETALAERELHDFLDGDLMSIRIAGEGKSREVLRGGPSNKRVWADPSTPEKGDETVTNWLNKVERLRPTEYVEDVPSGHDLVVRIEYRVKGAEGPVFLELAKTPGPTGKPEYFVRTEHTRLWAKVFASAGDQVDQDLPSVLAGR